MEKVSLMREHIKEVSDEADEETVAKVFQILKDEFNKEDPLSSLTTEQEASLLKSMAQADRGETIPHAEVMKKYEKWLSK